MSAMPLEADTRLLIDKRLENLGWRLKDEHDKKRNVYFEQPRTDAEKRNLGGKRPDYVLYSDEYSGQALVIIEAKKKGERIDTALEQGIQYARELNAPLVFATDGLFCRAYHVTFEKTPLLNGEEVDELLREALALKYVNAWEVHTVSQKVQYDRRELIKVFDEANNMLRADGLRAGIERFGEFANILFLKLISENEQTKRESGMPSLFNAAWHWDNIQKIHAGTRIEYINSIVYKSLNDLYQTDIFTPLTMRDTSILKEIMDKLTPLTLTDVDSDVKGDAFEYFLKASASSKNDLGEYFTPRHIVKTMVNLVNPQIGEKVYDPFCGTGGFLIESFRHIYNTMPRNTTTETMLREQTIFGNEITNTARITKMNMILTGDGHSNVDMQDSLARPVNGKYDIVITNMPYSQKTKHGILYDLPSNNGDSICVQHCMKAISALSENGRMALVVPEGFLFRKDIAKVRELLLSHCQLQTIISLPQGVFLPYTGVKTNILYATKVNQKLKSNEKRKHFWYFPVKNDGYTLDNHRRKLDGSNDLDRFQEYSKLDDSQRQSMLQAGFETIPLNKVRDNGFILLGSRYREQKITYGDYLTVKLGDILSYEQPTAYIVDTTDYDDSFPTPVLTAGKTFILGYTNEEHGVFRSPLPVIIFDDFTTATKLVDFPFKVKSSAMKILKANKTKINIKYIYYAMQGIAIDSSSHKRYWIEEYSKLSIPLPQLEVQQQIVDELDSYQKIVDGARSIVESYKPIVKTKQEWGMATVGDLFHAMSLTVEPQDKTGNVNYIGLENIEEGNGNLTGDIQTQIQTIKSTKRVFRKCDILYGKLRPNLNKVWYADFDGICSTDIIVLRPRNDSVLAEFYSIYLRSSIFNAFVLNGVSGGQLPRVHTDYFLALPVHNVPLAEQHRILNAIQTDQALIDPCKHIVELFTRKIQDRVNEIWGEQ